MRIGTSRLGEPGDEWLRVLPRPTPQFRRRAWTIFERALDPLAPPRRLPMRPPR